MRDRFGVYAPLVCFEADDGAGSGGENGDPAGEDGDKPYAVFPDARSFNSRLNREAQAKLLKKAQDAGFESVEAMDAALAEHKKRRESEQSDLEKAQAEAERYKVAAEQARKNAEQTLINASAQLQAVELGIAPGKVKHALRLADLSGVTLGEDGRPDGEAIKAALEAVLTDLPELKGAAAAGNVGSGSNPPGGGNPPAKNPWTKEHRNLTEQARLLRENPALAKQLQAAAAS